MCSAETPEPLLRILLAEDEPLAAMVVEEVLADLGHEVFLAPDGQAALDLAEGLSFDVLVTDLAMPRLPGWDLVRRLRAVRPELPVVVMTGFLPPGVPEMLQASGEGPMVLLDKPFEIGALVGALRALVGHPQARHGRTLPARVDKALSLQPMRVMGAGRH